MSRAVIFLLKFALIFCSCSRNEIKSPQEAMRPSTGPEHLTMEQAISNWSQPIRDEHLKLNIKWLLKRPERQLTFGKCELPARDYAQSLTELLEKDDKTVMNLIRQKFKFFEVYGKDEWGEVLLTSYYSPVIKGSRVPTEKFTQPLYRTPKDLTVVDMGSYIEKEIIQSEEDSKGLTAGRMIKDRHGKIYKVIPFFSRLEIDRELALKGRGLELAYVDPIDAFFLQIQGSGVIEFADGTSMSLGYAAQNGHRYYSIGKSLFDIIPKDEMSKNKLVHYLKSLTERERNYILDKNQSYVFFRELETKFGQTTYGPSVIAKRTVAIDYRVFPMGGVAFLDFLSPQITTYEDLEKFNHDALEPEGRFVLAHDSGGAIRGPGRVDLYWGKGEFASYNAGVMRHKGQMWFLVPSQCGEVTNG